jgi:hypothetical protein
MEILAALWLLYHTFSFHSLLNWFTNYPTIWYYITYVVERVSLNKEPVIQSVDQFWIVLWDWKQDLCVFDRCLCIQLYRSICVCWNYCIVKVKKARYFMILLRLLQTLRSNNEKTFKLTLSLETPWYCVPVICNRKHNCSNLI